MKASANPVRPHRIFPGSVDDLHLERRWARGTAPAAIADELAAKGWGRDAAFVRMRLLAQAALGRARVGARGPIGVALEVLGGAAVAADEAPGGFRFRGTPATTVIVISAANERLVALGLPAIAYPCAWRRPA